MTIRPIMLVDAMNVFVRCYCAFPSMSTHGYQAGGTVGFLKTLRKLINDHNPSSVYVVWEGGGSKKRRDLYSDYKATRRPEKLNRFYEDDIPDTDENKIQQISIVAKLIRCLPVCQLYVKDCEGDDVIAYLSRYVFDKEQKIIISGDRDFYQLMNDRTVIYSPNKKRIVKPQDVLDEFRISCANFAMAKSLCGDVSDNIPGVKGLGFKTLTKRFPFFASDEQIMIDDIVNFCNAHTKESSIYPKVVENLELIKRNWQLIYLDASSIAPVQIEQIKYAVNTFKPSVSKIGFIKHLISEGLTDFEVDNFFYTFLCLNTQS